jgi:hypothetical protein
LGAQTADPGTRLADWVPAHTGRHWRVGFEQRVRYEYRGGNGFVPEADTFTALERTRVSLTYENGAVKASAMFQDARAPWYGSPAPGNLRDTADLQEAYVELFPKRKTGWGAFAGRVMLNYGESRIIGSPQWGNTARTYDHARLSYATSALRVEALLISPVKVRTDAFNKPVLSERLWGVYCTARRGDVYFLRHENVGGFAVNMFGFRLTGTIARGWKYSAEGIAQSQGAGWFSGVSRRWNAGKGTVDVSAEYKFASRSFDQFSPANHDKFGHQDIFGWRNMHNARWLATYSPVKALAVNLMYNHIWLASACEPLYGSAGRAIARSASCAAGRDVGQGMDLFAVYRFRHFQTGAGFGRFFPGEFLRQTTPAAAATYAYVFHAYSF